jgi:predicted RNA-binding Zn ribbon-like protein
VVSVCIMRFQDPFRMRSDSWCELASCARRSRVEPWMSGSLQQRLLEELVLLHTSL